MARNRVETAAIGSEGVLGQLGRTPQAAGGWRDPVVELADQPGTTQFGRQMAALEAFGPVVRPGTDAGIELVLTHFAGDFKGAHEARRGHQHARILVEVKALARLDAGAQQDVLDLLDIGDQVGAGAALDLDAGFDIAVPAARQLLDADPRFAQDVGPVQHRARADVGRCCDHRAAAIGRLVIGEAGIALAHGADVVRGFCQIVEARAMGEAADIANLQRHHVGQVDRCRQGRCHRRVMVAVGAADHLDFDFGVQAAPMRDRRLDDLVDQREGRHRQLLAGGGLHASASQQASAHDGAARQLTGGCHLGNSWVKRLADMDGSA